MTVPTMVVRLVVRDLGEEWMVEGTWDVEGPVEVQALRRAAQWLTEEADDLERGAERAEASA